MVNERGLWCYTPNVMDDPVELGVGDSFDATFGSIFIPLAWGEGTATFTVNFSTPEPFGVAQDDADFDVWSVFIFSGGNLYFGAPADFGYSYNGVSGGILTVGFDDIDGCQLGSWVAITGTVTNTAAPVPEPATMLLLGVGLVGLAGAGRKKIFKK